RSDNTALTSKTTPDTGIVTFDAVPIGTYFVRATDLRSPEQFAPFDSSAKNQIKSVTENQTVEFMAEMSAIIAGTIRVRVKDSQSLQPLSNVNVTLLKDKVDLSTKTTASDGTVAFAVGDTDPVYGLRFDHPAYLVRSKFSISATDNVQEFFLDHATVDNTNSLQVKVVDQSNAPVENATVVLKKVDGSIASETLITGIFGIATFTRVSPDTYFAFVSKDGIGEANSDTVVVSEREPATVTVVLQIGTGSIEINVLDPGSQPLGGANVKAIDVFSGVELATQVTGADGKAVFSQRVDRKMYFEVNHAGFAPFYTIAVTPSANATRSLTAMLKEDIARLEVQFLGLFVDDQTTTDALKPGEHYSAHLLLLVPQNADLAEAGVHLRTGRSDLDSTNIMESDYIFLGKINSAAQSILRGTTYTPPIGFAEDSTHLTNTDAKWTNLVFSRPKGGVYQIEADVTVRDNTPLGTNLEINYRAWGKSGAYVRFPADAVLGESDSVQGKQGLYAVTKTKLYSVGPSGLCSNNFCTVIAIKDLSQDLQTSVLETFPAKPKTEYEVFFTLINTGQTTFGNAALELSTQSGGLSFGAYSVVDSSGVRHTGNANNGGSVTVP
ncbi:MAG: carboxypeptidase-like regulatory domain-containing protein, partial [Candidatus Diapherotrites archaeon]|nr:carboxypeptidase-like regulatory domain-containing protein [Candidatus Diapherotrites archaeon]